MDNYGNSGRFSKGGMFAVGFFSGVLVSALVLILLVGYLWRHPQAVLVKAADFGVKKVIEKTVESAPREYIGQKQDEIAVTAQKFAKAFSESRISPGDMQMLSAKMLGILADQKITQGEIDEMLRSMNQFAQ